MKKYFMNCFWIMILLLILVACNTPNETDEIELGESFIEELYTIDDANMFKKDLSVDELLDIQSEYSAYFTEEEYKSLASKRFFLLPYEVANKEGYHILVDDLVFTQKETDEDRTDYDFTFTLMISTAEEEKIDEMEVNGQMSFVKDTNELKISRYYDGNPLIELLYR